MGGGGGGSPKNPPPSHNKPPHKHTQPALPPNTHTPTHTHTNTHTPTHTRIHQHTHAITQTHQHTHPNTHTPTHTHEPPPTRQLHADCVARINMYRSGQLTFKDGSRDAVVQRGLDPLVESTSGHRCSSEQVFFSLSFLFPSSTPFLPHVAHPFLPYIQNEAPFLQALGDLLYNVRHGGGCAGGHHTAFTCAWGESVGQNSCCARGDGSWGRGDRAQYETYSQVRAALYECLQMMWDEGITRGQVKKNLFSVSP